MKSAIRLRKIETITEVPFIDLKRFVLVSSEEILSDWSKVLSEAEFVGGKRVTRFEKELESRLGAQSALACANGTDALILALQACGIKAGKKVALPNLTFWATYEAVVQVGATPVLIDISPDDLQMDLKEFKEAYRKIGFDAAILVHLFGWASPALDGFRSFCEKQGIPLIEDGAQSFGVKWKGRSVYEGARISTLSFYPAKVLGGAMDGGAIVGSDRALIDSCRVLANHGRAEHYSYSRVGWNSRMGGLQAAFLLEMLNRVDDAIASRRRAQNFYHEYLDEFVRSGRLRAWMPPSGCEGNGYLAVFSGQGDTTGGELQKELSARKVGCGRIYPETIIDQACVPRDVLRISELPHSREFVRGVINLPLFAGITEGECRFAAANLADILGEEP